MNNRNPTLAEVRNMVDLYLDLAEQVREHCPVLPSEVVRSLAVVDFAVQRLRNGALANLQKANQ